MIRVTSGLEQRFEELERGLLSGGEVPADVAERTRTWLEATAEALTRELARAAPVGVDEAAPPPDAGRARRATIAAARDVAWLCATARGAGLFERRAAFARLLRLARAGLDRAGRAAIEALLGRRHAAELALDALLLAEAATASRDARERLEQSDALGQRFAVSVRAFTEGASSIEPLDALAANDRALLLLHLRRRPADVAAYVASGLERALGAADVESLLDLLGALRPSADRRLLPTLARAVLDDGRPEVRAAAASAFARIDDPRVPRVLAAAAARASDLVERLVLAEGLALWGDRRGAPDAAAALDETDEVALKLALAAVAALADPDLAERAFSVGAASSSREVRVAAARTIGRAADARGLAWLDELEGGASAPEVLRGNVSLARDAILARLEARGEAPPARYDRRADPIERALARPPGEPATKRHRWLARWTLVRAMIARIFGRARSAANAYARAAAIDPSYAWPLLVEARWRLTNGDRVEAVRCYRRLVALDPSALSARPRDLSNAVRVLLARADDLEEAGRTEMAREILEDLFVLDLTRCDASLRVEVRRRRDRPLLTRAPSGADASGPFARALEAT